MRDTDSLREKVIQILKEENDSNHYKTGILIMGQK